jgi:DNA mismatch repair protein MutS2
MIGVPGTSNAFAIAARLGLPSPIVQAARGMIGTDRAVLSDVIQRLTEDQRATETDLRKAAEAAREGEEKRQQAERELRHLRTERADILARARAEADTIVRAARKEMDRFRDELRRLEKDARKSAGEAGNAAALQKVRDRLQELSGGFDRRAEELDENNVPEPREAPAPQPAMEIDTRRPVPGDLVWVVGLNQRGTLLSEAEGRAQVQIGSMRMTVPMETVQRLITPKIGAARPALAGAPAGRSPDVRMQARANISPQVDLRGMRAEEALAELDRYVDEACLAGLSPFRIVHGKGTGALKKVAWEFLQGHPNISRFRHPAEEEGGGGVTVVELRD